MPEYPQGAQARGVTGVVVAEVEVGVSGAVSQVTVLQAPSDDIKDAVGEALKKWRFKPLTFGGGPARARGKLTFYYVIDHGKAIVRNAEPKDYQQTVLKRSTP
jgi:TonB family protein